jgi:hypothetical protein
MKKKSSQPDATQRNYCTGDVLPDAALWQLIKMNKENPNSGDSWKPHITKILNSGILTHAGINKFMNQHKIKLYAVH